MNNNDADVERYLDATFDTLRVRERRHTLRYLQEESGSASLDDITAYLENKTGRKHENLDVSLAHNHLPKMEEHGWIDYDQRNEQVRDATIDQDTKDRILIEYVADMSGQDEDYMDAVFDVMAKERKRKTLYALDAEEDGRSTLKGLVYTFTDDDEEAEKLQIRLQHNTLPALEDAGFIEYDPDTRKVSMAQAASNLPFPYLREIYGGTGNGSENGTE